MALLRQRQLREIRNGREYAALDTPNEKKIDISKVEGRLLQRTLENLHHFHSPVTPWSKLFASESYAELEWRFNHERQ